MDDPHQMAGKTWHWLRSRILQLLKMPPAHVIPDQQKGKPALIVPATRIGWALQPRDRR